MADRKIKTQKAVFYPTGSLQGKCNYKKFLRIARDGSIVERVFLNVLDERHREQIICLHYLRFLAQDLLDCDIGMKMLERDNPWDFRLELSNGMEFNLEITAIADSEEHFTINKREERLTHWMKQTDIPIHELRKLENLFPDNKLAKYIQEFLNQGMTVSEEVKNPLLNPNMQIYISSMLDPQKTLEELLVAVIEKKCSKLHQDKEDTVLIIDNRTSFFDAKEYQNAAALVDEYLQSTPFKEIWFYTGYCSDDDGNNAEFCFAPLKIPSNYRDRIKALMEVHGADSSGRVIV